MAGNPLIETYLADLARRLPAPRRHRAAILDELHTGLLDALDAHPLKTTDPGRATQDVLAEFGPAEVVAAAYTPELSALQGRRTASLALAAVPVLAALWSATLLLGPPAPWATEPGWLPAAAHVLAASVIATIICALAAITAAGRGSRLLRNPRIPQLIAAAATIAVTTAASTVMAITTVRGIIAPDSLTWPAVLAAGATTAAVLTAIGRSARRSQPQPMSNGQPGPPEPRSP